MENFNQDKNRQFLADQGVEIKKHRWVESEKAGYDVGVEAELEWIKKFAGDYRKWWFSNR